MRLEQSNFTLLHFVHPLAHLDFACIVIERYDSHDILVVIVKHIISVGRAQRRSRRIEAFSTSTWGRMRSTYLGVAPREVPKVIAIEMLAWGLCGRMLTPWQGEHQ